MNDKAPAFGSPLSQLYVYVTNRCNCSCRHCWIFAGRGGDPKKTYSDLDPSVFEAALTEAEPLGLNSIKWTGGEPTIHPRFEALLAIQKKHGLSGRMETNGLEVSPELARLLAESGVRHVSVSVDGSTPETHDAIRGVKGSYRRMLEGVRNLVAVGYQPQLILSLMTDNAPEIEGLLKMALKVGAGSVKFNLVQPTLRGEDLHAHGQTLPVSELIAIHQRLEREFRPRYPFPILMDIPMAFRPLGEIMDGNACSLCGIKSILGLLADGTYALCGIGENLPELVLGPAGKGELSRIWGEHPILQQVRRGLPAELKGICSRCLMAKVCLGACVAQNYYRSKDLMGAFWFCEAAEEQGIFPKERLP
jgi:SynChlorMet cassette radical SAM/SPASM protein ScmF